MALQEHLKKLGACHAAVERARNYEDVHNLITCSDYPTQWKLWYLVRTAQIGVDDLKGIDALQFDDQDDLTTAISLLEGTELPKNNHTKEWAAACNMDDAYKFGSEYTRGVLTAWMDARFPVVETLWGYDSTEDMDLQGAGCLGPA